VCRGRSCPTVAAALTALSVGRCRKRQKSGGGEGVEKKLRLANHSSLKAEVIC